MPQKQDGFLAVRRLRSGKKPELYITVSKGIIRRAVDRNVLKRRIRSILSPLLKQSGLSYKVMVRSKKILSVSFHNMEEEIKKQLNTNG